MRICDECNRRLFDEGYVIDGGTEYYCTDECKDKHISEDGWDRLFGDGDTDSYWTEFDEITIPTSEDEMDITINEFTEIVLSLFNIELEQIKQFYINMTPNQGDLIALELYSKKTLAKLVEGK